MKDVEILYLAWNRLDMTALTWHLLIANTDWDLVTKLTVYDDGSEDGTLEFLRERIGDCPVEHELRESDLRSPPAIMNHFLAEKRAPLFAKIDNDIACPRGWLNAGHDVMHRFPDLELLGMEAGQAGKMPEGNFTYKFARCTHIGGVGLMRTSAFQDEKRGALPFRGRYGFGDWQQRYNVKRGWITPDLMMPQLDRLPMEPWPSLSETYIRNGWQRNWGPYPVSASAYWDWMGDILKTEDAA